MTWSGLAEIRSGPLAHVTIDGRDFELDKLSGEARQQAMTINLVDQEIRRLPFQPAIC